MRKGTERIPGFQEDIHPGVWQPHTIWGAKQKWAELWIAICLICFMYIICTLPFKLVPPLIGIWLVGHTGLIALTKWDPNWDDVFLQRRRYKKKYEAG